ncbi:AGAP004245-PA-like protein [Anopheles sinensis]|uniref:AGAP004245-PA-like protein n=1 Tax=Anopheles sinensis TaxID=74873 RepID=A0A084VA58_ANOSI|nr:AGAP004245-PA-like protein [Anopheles sinensis]
MPSVYLGVHLPFRPYQKLKLENVDLSLSTLQTLWCEAVGLIKCEVLPSEFEFIYCGSVLKPDDILQNKGITDGSMIHVIHKRRENDPSVDEVKPQEERHLTEAEVQKVLSAAPAAPMGGDLGVQTQSHHTAMAASIGQYRSELELMREMGLTDTETNLQALIVATGT